jgi:hypothetical protein
MQPEVRAFFGKPLQRKGTNIEGLACKDGKLYVGFRSPNLDGKAAILETDAEKLFNGKVLVSQMHLLPVAPGRGIRELVACRDGFLFIAGDAGSESSSAFPDPVDFTGDKAFTLHFWDPKSPDAAVQQVGVAPESGGKAEALLILDESDTEIHALVLYDGAGKGGAKHIVLTKPARK